MSSEPLRSDKICIGKNDYSATGGDLGKSRSLMKLPSYRFLQKAQIDSNTKNTNIPLYDLRMNENRWLSYTAAECPSLLL